MRRKKKASDKAKPTDKHTSASHRNKPLSIPLDFDKAVEGLLNVKPRKKKPDGAE